MATQHSFVSGGRFLVVCPLCRRGSGHAAGCVASIVSTIPLATPPPLQPPSRLCLRLRFTI